jgi:hypothetical protein
MATYETAQDKSVTVGDTTFTYRKLGQPRGVPLVLLMGFRCVRCGNSQHFAPELISI